MRVGHGGWRTVLGLELRLQVREPLTWLYAIVLLTLTAGFTGSGVVALVPRALRGDAAATAPLVLALAMSGLGAFAQVITTMVMVTAMLRDIATRTAPLLLASPISTADLLTGRVAAALIVLAIVTLGMPVGAVVGALATDASVMGVAVTAMGVWVGIVLPTVLLTGAVQAWVATRSASLYVTLAATLVLLVLWQVTTSSTVVDMVGPWSVALDPFGSAPLLATTRAQRALETASPWTALLTVNRVGAVIVGLAVLAVVRRGRRPRAAEAVRAPRTAASPVRAPRRTDVMALPPSTAGGWRDSAALAWRTLSRERAFVIIAALGAINVAANVWSALAPRATTATLGDALSLAITHGRLFCILLATIWAGELLWRERDLRVDGLIDASPISTSASLLGRVATLLAVEGVVAVTLAGSAVVAASTAGVRLSWRAAPEVALWTVAVCWLPFALLTLLSLAVHVLVRHKVVAHLLLITTWVVAVALDGAGFDRAWYRVGAVAPGAWSATRGAQPLLPWVSLHWALVAVTALLVARLGWPRGRRIPRPSRSAWVALAVCLVLVALSARAVDVRDRPERTTPPTGPVGGVGPALDQVSARR
ncbi:MAG: hypothetical protein MUE41_08900 [Gemmatimonadaceae bacterium]|nr:hypothetical protein [Gemmatimonadaceae bacterium]